MDHNILAFLIFLCFVEFNYGPLFEAASSCPHCPTIEQETYEGRECILRNTRRNKFVSEICALLGYYVASCGNSLPTFRDNVSVPSSRVKSPSRKESQQPMT